MLTSLVPHSLLVPCKEGALRVNMKVSMHIAYFDLYRGLIIVQHIKSVQKAGTLASVSMIDLLIVLSAIAGASAMLNIWWVIIDDIDMSALVDASFIRYILNVAILSVPRLILALHFVLFQRSMKGPHNYEF